MSHWYRIDDDDRQIAYSGVWETIRDGAAYSGGAHSTTQNGASATLTFKGTGIKVYMRVPTGDWNQISLYQIQGDTIQRHIECKINEVTYNVETFIREGLGEGPHTIVISQDGINGGPRGGAPIQLDWIEVLTSDLDPNPAPIYPPGVSPPNTPAPTSTIRTVNPPPANSSPLSSSQNLPNAPNQTQGPQTTVDRGSTNDDDDGDSPGQFVRTSTSIMSGSSVVSVEAAPSQLQSPSWITTTDANGEHVVTKIIPERIFTVTDSTGGLSVRTEVADSAGNDRSGPSTGLLVGVIVAALVLAASLGIVALLMWRRKKRRTAENSETRGEFGAGLVADRDPPPLMGEVHVKPYTLHLGQSPPGSPLPSSSGFTPSSGGPPSHSRDLSTTGISTSVPDEAPPAYRMSGTGEEIVGLSAKEHANMYRP